MLSSIDCFFSIGIKKSLLVVDMPKNSYNSSNQAEKNAKLIIKKTGCDAVKLESNNKNFNIIEIQNSSISCMN